jgi:EAL domain-containing protein (putative c-di-GMP-specific phosphodiesterase class I)
MALQHYNVLPAVAVAFVIGGTGWRTIHREPFAIDGFAEHGSARDVLNGPATLPLTVNASAPATSDATAGPEPAGTHPATAKRPHQRSLRTIAPSQRASQKVDISEDVDSYARHLQRDIEYWLQPIVDAATGKLSSYEALARLRDPVAGLLEPCRFLNKIERLGLDRNLDDIALHHAVRHADSLRAAGSPATIAVNLSNCGLALTTFPKRFTSILNRVRLEPWRLTVELSERDIASDQTAVVRTLRDLRDRGVGISLDDFGTGYSSLTRLRQIPVDEVKIDQSFIKGVTTNSIDRVIVRSIIDLSHDLGMTVAAEGVEDRETLDYLRELGADRIQGFIFSRPRPAADVLRENHESQVLVLPALEDSTLGS